MNAIADYCLTALMVLLMFAQVTPGYASAPNQQTLASGFQGLEVACFSCHSPDPGAAAPVAPTMAAIREGYLTIGADFESFSAAIERFVKTPTIENAVLPGAVEKFGLMPKLSIDDGVLNAIAYYLYQSDLQDPNWYVHQYVADKQAYGAAKPLLNNLSDYRSYGGQLALQTKSALGSNLKRALQRDGASGAVSFCKTRAIPITQEMSVNLEAEIRRVSDRPRNPSNAASSLELEAIDSFHALLQSGEPLVPIVQEAEHHVVGYYPIVTNGMCLQCHGVVGKDIEPSTHAVIQNAYPSDQATGYTAQALRGIFVVTMQKSSGASEDAGTSTKEWSDHK